MLLRTSVRCRFSYARMVTMLDQLPLKAKKRITNSFQIALEVGE